MRKQTSEEIFAEYATSTAFQISLTKNQVKALLSIDHKDEFWNHKKIHEVPHLGSFRSLEHRGLCEWLVDKNGLKNGPSLTEVGKMVLKLVKISLKNASALKKAV